MSQQLRAVTALAKNPGSVPTTHSSVTQSKEKNYTVPSTWAAVGRFPPTTWPFNNNTDGENNAMEGMPCCAKQFSDTFSITAHCLTSDKPTRQVFM